VATFIDLLKLHDPSTGLLEASSSIRNGAASQRVFQIDEEQLTLIPGSSFIYWLSDNVRNAYARYSAFVNENRELSRGASTMDDFRYLRLSWEVPASEISVTRKGTMRARWVPFAKGGSFSQISSSVYLLVNWGNDGSELKAAISEYRGSRGWGFQWSAALNGHSFYFRPGLTWPRRTSSLSVRALPAGCIFADKGATVFVRDDDPRELLALCGLLNSRAFLYFVSHRTQLAQSFEVGLLKTTPIPEVSDARTSELYDLSLEIWRAKAQQESCLEQSVFFRLPSELVGRIFLRKFNDIDEIITADLNRIDQVAFDLWGFNDLDRAIAGQLSNDEIPGEEDFEDEDEDDGDIADTGTAMETTADLLSWCLGVAFGRFDWRLATGVREVPP
jgi:hypothetical protein